MTVEGHILHINNEVVKGITYFCYSAFETSYKVYFSIYLYINLHSTYKYV